MKRLARTAVAIMAAVLLLGSDCTGPDGDTAPFVVVLLDSTASTRGDQRDAYLADLGTIVASCAAEECTLVVIGVADSTGSAPPPRTFTFAPPDRYADQPDDWYALQALGAAEHARGILFAGDAPGDCTDLISAFDEAAKSLAAATGEKHIVALSDGRHSCMPDLVEMAKSDWPGSAAVVGDLEDTGRVADLGGASVWIAGFGRLREGRPSPPTEVFVNLEDFWQEFVSASNGVVAPGGIAADLNGYPPGS